MSSDNANKQLESEIRSVNPSLSRRRGGVSLGSALLMTRDLKSLIQGFATEVRALLPCEGIEYVNSEHAIRVSDGVLRRHRCTYTLRIKEESLGHMVFTRSWRFAKEEFMLLESLLVELLVPLLRALVHHGSQRRHNPERRRVSAASAPKPGPSDTPRLEGASDCAARPQLSLVPLGEYGDYLPEPSESRSNVAISAAARVGEASPSELPFIDENGPSHQKSIGTDEHARLAQVIDSSGMGEQDLFDRARKVLGYHAYSDAAIALMQRLAARAAGTG